MLPVRSAHTPDIRRPGVRLLLQFLPGCTWWHWRLLRGWNPRWPSSYAQGWKDGWRAQRYCYPWELSRQSGRAGDIPPGSDCTGVPCRYCLRRELMEEILLPMRNKRQLLAQPHVDSNLSCLYLGIHRKAHPGGITRRSASHPVRQRFLRVPKYWWILRASHIFVLRAPAAGNRVANTRFARIAQFVQWSRNWNGNI